MLIPLDLQRAQPTVVAIGAGQQELVVVRRIADGLRHVHAGSKRCLDRRGDCTRLKIQSLQVEDQHVTRRLR